MNLSEDTIRWLVSLFIAGCGAIYTWIATRDRDNTVRIEAVEKTLGKRIAVHGEQLARLEKDVEVLRVSLENIPTKDELAHLQGDLKEVRAVGNATREEIRTIRQSLSRIEDFLLHNGAR
ncbi:MAG: DUF2730 domain-containing protein [Betaproteobacteria bacterium]|nr:DUF2730 domain-containing protein [Betaproteobacteria bacterium]